jgi:hypothetical protein
MPMASNFKNELWIDLKALVSSSHAQDGFTVIYYQYSEEHPEPLYDHITYGLRVALRAVKHKITKIEHMYRPDLTCVMKSYVTDIPHAVWEEKTKLWNEWIGGVVSEFSVSSDSESDDSESSESDSTDLGDPSTT